MVEIIGRKSRELGKGSGRGKVRVGRSLLCRDRKEVRGLKFGE